jgi:hypothetical protein
MRKAADELKDAAGAGQPPKSLSIETVRKAIDTLKAANEKISTPTGQKGDVVKKLREKDGIDMPALGLLVKLSNMSEEKLASFWETFQFAEALGYGKPKDLFDGNGADEPNAKKRAKAVTKALNGNGADLH